VDISFRDGDPSPRIIMGQPWNQALHRRSLRGSHATNDLWLETIAGFVVKAAQLTSLLDPDSVRYTKGLAPDLGFVELGVGG
jgi:hypothetical protein